MSRYEIDSGGPARHAAWLVGLFVGVMFAVPVSAVLSVLTGWWF